MEPYVVGGSKVARLGFNTMYKHIGLKFMASGWSHIYRNQPGFYFEAFLGHLSDDELTYGITERSPNTRRLHIGFTVRVMGRLYGARILTWG